MSEELFNSRQGKEIFPFFKACILTLGSSNLLFNIGVSEGPCTEVVRTGREADHSRHLVPRLRMSWAVPAFLFLYAFMECRTWRRFVVVTYSARSECCREGLPVRKHVVTTERMAMKRYVCVRWKCRTRPYPCYMPFCLKAPSRFTLLLNVPSFLVKLLLPGVALGH